MKIISVANQKGGCGKTTISINLASCLSLQGKRVLLVDMDPQGHSGLGLAVPDEQVEFSICDVLSAPADKPEDLGKAIWQIGKNFDLLPATVELAGFEQQFSGTQGRELRLANALQPVSDKYDYCIIDCPPSLGLLTFNALRASSGVLIPVETGYFSIHGLSRQLETLDLLKKQCNHELTVRVIPNLYDVRTKLGREMLAELRKRFGDMLTKVHINFNTKLKESASLGQSIGEYDPSSTGFHDFSQLAEEVIATFETHKTESQIDQSLEQRIQDLSTKAQKLLAETSSKLGTEPGSFQEASAEKKLEVLYGVSQSPDGVRFLTHFDQAKKVSVAGDFNNWSAEDAPMKRIDGFNGDWELLLPLEEGRYQYRIVVDGVWQHDPNNNYVESNPYGELNSVLEVH